MRMELTRRQLLAALGKAAALSPLYSLAFSQAGCGGGGASGPASGGGGGGFNETDDQLLDDIERAGFLFFWEQTDPATGQVKDRALAIGNDSRTLSSIAATGFGLTVLCIGHQRGYGVTANITNRVRTTLNFLLNQMPSQNGFFYHFVDMSTGARAGTSEVSSIDTAILLCGVLTCRAHFQDAQINSLATQLYERVDWNWMLNGGTTFSMGWTPENGFITTRWDTYSELMMLYLLALSSPTHSIPASSWTAWSRPIMQYQGMTYISGAPPLFVHQYSHAWFDFRNKRDAFADYFQNSITATQAHKLFCLSLAPSFSDYTDGLWGVTASDSVHGYVAWGGPPSLGPIDGTVVPAAAGGSVAFLFPDTLRVLRTMRSIYGAQAWKRYGFVDAFNPLTGWYDPDVLGIDLGIMVLMAENARTQFVWNTFMQNPEAGLAMQLAGFH